MIWVISCLCALVILEWDVPINSMGSDLFSYRSILIRSAVLPFGIIIVFWGLLYEKTWIKHILETRLFDLLGKSSYTFYLIHGGILNVALNKYVTTNILIKFVITNAIAVLVYLYIERPIHKRLTYTSR